ncbi:MAG: hypothetical protein JJU45_15215 [Acidimicrobiia bacterium]|nr:hypothetical protein [Acidimicrobiia bacterium]
MSDEIPDGAPSPAQPSKGRQAGYVLIGFVVVLAIAGVGFGVYQAVQPGDPLEIRGTYTLFSPGGIVRTGDTCRGERGYSDFAPGVRVSVRDGDGSIVGSGRTVSVGELDHPDLQDGDDIAPNVVCTLVFAVEVQDVDFYDIEIGSRGSMVMSRTELEADDWFVELTLGT